MKPWAAVRARLFLNLLAPANQRGSRSKLDDLFRTVGAANSPPLFKAGR